jgi:hypothetical protein
MNVIDAGDGTSILSARGSLRADKFASLITGNEIERSSPSGTDTVIL